MHASSAVKVRCLFRGNPYGPLVHGVTITFDYKHFQHRNVCGAVKGTQEPGVPARSAPPQQPGRAGGAEASASSGSPAKRQRTNARQRRSRARLEKFLEAKRTAAADTGAMAVDPTSAAQ